MVRLVRSSITFVFIAGLALSAWAGGANARDPSFRILHFFIRHAVDGKYDGNGPMAAPVLDKQGNLYGTTEDGGGPEDNFHGTVFKLAPDGTETILHAFKGGSDGYFPRKELIIDGAGNLYGTTTDGGGRGCRGGGCGTVFKVTPDGSESVLYAFAGGRDGGYPLGGLLLDKQGNLYGTTVNSGSKQCFGGCGVVFKIAPDGTETVLYRFKGGDDGASPLGGLISDDAGNLYGTTEIGGAGFCDGEGCGIVFKLSPDGTETILHTFTGGSDGAAPFGRLLADDAGNLYGTTYDGGGSGCSGYGCGTVFRLAPDGTETILYSFAGGSDGENPGAGLIADKAGNLYGTTIQGGARCRVGYCGTVFKLAPDGTKTILRSFGGGYGGGGLYGGLVMDGMGNLYGTTWVGGRGCRRLGCGIVFEITP